MPLAGLPQAASLLIQLSHLGPSIVAVCLRCGWKMGDVLSRYLRFADAGDQYTGRIAAGLDSKSSSFAVVGPSYRLPSPRGLILNRILKACFPKHFILCLKRHPLVTIESNTLFLYCYAVWRT